MTSALRLRYLLAKKGPVIVAVLLVLGTFLVAGAGVAYADPPTTEITYHTDKQTVSTTLTTAATVTGNTSIYESGQILKEQPIYLLEATPNAELSVTTTMPQGTGGDAAHQLQLVYTARRNGETFWEHSEPLTVETRRSDGQTVSTTTFTMPGVREQISTYRDEFGDAATISVDFRVTTKYTVGQYEGELVETFPVSIGNGWYSIDSGTVSKTHSTPVSRTQRLPLDRHLPFVLPLSGGLLLLLTGLLTVLTVRRSNGDSTNGLADSVHRARYAEWISTGILLDPTIETTVQMDSLEALVDVAIDTNKRVIHDPGRNQYAVLDTAIRYNYTPR